MVWDVIYKQLKSNGFEVYTPGQHKGDCLSPYVVVKPSSSMQFNEFSTNVITCDVLCYVPKDNFSHLAPFVAQVKQALKSLFPQVKESHWEFPGFADDSNKSHMWSIQYQSYQKFYNS